MRIYPASVRNRGMDAASPLLAGPVDAVVSTFGPFAIAVAIFVFGAVGYFSLLAIRRRWG